MSDLQNIFRCASVYHALGNVFAQYQYFQTALNSYNASICHARQDKDLLALAYVDRSSVCFECNEFDACLTNIQLAMDHNYPQNKMAALNERKFKCLKLMESSLNCENHWEFLKLSYPANVKVPFIVDCLELKTNEVFGRHVITNKDLKVGDIVAIEKPHTTILDKISHNCCATCCTTKPFEILPCSIRTDDMFCSEACKELAMKTFLRIKSRDENGKHVEMITRMYLNALVLFDGSIEDMREFLCANQSPSKTIFDYDFSSPDEIENEKNRLLAMFALNDEVDFTNKDIKEFVKYFMTCTVKISSDYTTSSLNESFHGLYLFDPILNYSITPNTVALQFDTKKLHLVIRPISKGEQLFTCYRSCKLHSMDVKTCSRFQDHNKFCNLKRKVRKARGNLILHEPPTWPIPSWSPLDRSSNVKLAIERFKYYCGMLQSSPELLSNYDNGILITEYMISCLSQIISNKPF